MCKVNQTSGQWEPEHALVPIDRLQDLIRCLCGRG